MVEAVENMAEPQLDESERGLVPMGIELDQPGVADALLQPGQCKLLGPVQRSQIDRATAQGQLDTVVSASLMTLSAAPFLGQSLDRVAQSGASAKLRAAAEIGRAHV